MVAPYSIRTDPNVWTAYDITTGMPAKVNGGFQIGLSLYDADDLAELLNRLHTQQLAATSH
jgi:hypothetical protein